MNTANASDSLTESGARRHEPTRTTSNQKTVKKKHGRKRNVSWIAGAESRKIFECRDGFIGEK